jgi:hypothetical protein
MAFVRVIRQRFQLENLANMTLYKIIYSAVDEKPEITCKWLKELVGAIGFEPTASWSRTRRASQAALRPDGATRTENQSEREN